ncbi:unannotated protein [freshwater metagenome]|uniref:Unannotated protein n=1 Tax=freshwater metagenome TaxID=449393 RepID=A0A6J7IZ50_9ZZZZ|nr:hypothetical protein [Actinomycetota bacterium]
MTSHLFRPLTLRGMTFSNRVWVAPMCQYSATDGVASSWHMQHLGALATGRPGLIITEAAAVSPEGRITQGCLGLWTDEQAEALAPIVEFIHGQGVPIAVQLAHSGRKGSTWSPWTGVGAVDAADGGWQTIAPSPIAFSDWPEPCEMTETDIASVTKAFADAARRAVAVGVDTVELHSAHGYLMHEFLSPLSNQRTDGYGGSLANRMRFPLEVIDAVRAALPDDRPLLMRVSGTDWVEGGWDIEQTVIFAREAQARGVDLVDLSSAGLHHEQNIPFARGYQVPFSARVRKEVGVPTGAVGLIIEPEQAEAILADGEADVVLIGRAMLRQPHWPLLAAHALGEQVEWPPQYEKGRPH